MPHRRQGLRLRGWLRGRWTLDLDRAERDALLEVLEQLADPGPLARVRLVLRTTPGQPAWPPSPSPRSSPLPGG